MIAHIYFLFPWYSHSIVPFFSVVIPGIVRIECPAAGGTEVQLLPGMSSIQHHLNQVRWSVRGKNVSCKIGTRTIMEKVYIYNNDKNTAIIIEIIIINY